MELKKLALEKRPIVVELEGGIIRGNIFAEGVWALIRAKPLNIFRVLYWYISGDLLAKSCSAVNGSRPLPPVRHEIINYLKEKKEQGYPVILKHNRHRDLANHLQKKYVCFSDLTSHLPEKIERTGFTLVTPNIESKLWSKAHDGVLISQGNERTCKDLSSVYGIDISPLPGKRDANLFIALLKSLRPHQWLKSVLVFVPLILSNQSMSLNNVLLCLLAFISFACVSSANYILNDLFDIDADRAHPNNIKRPFASGSLPLAFGPAIYLALIVLGFFVASKISYAALGIIAFYTLLAHLYTFILKRLPILDTFTLSGLYCLRIFLGASVIGISLSHWLYLSAGFFFFSLANMKRVSELKILGEGQKIKRRGYQSDDLIPLAILGITSAFAFGICYPLFLINAQNLNFASPVIGSPKAFLGLLWLIDPILLYWFCHIWLLAWRNKMASDPVKFALIDPVSHCCFYSVFFIWIFVGLN